MKRDVYLRDLDLEGKDGNDAAAMSSQATLVSSNNLKHQRTRKHSGPISKTLIKGPMNLIPSCHIGSKDSCSNSSDSSSDDSSSNASGDTDPNRGGWSGRLEFLLSCISYAVGLGNIWRFPYLCYQNGGGAFLIPYIIFLLLCGMPLFFLEVSYGQFASLSPITVWRMSPFFKGIGYGMVIISGIVCIYYNIIITWTLYYLYSSFAAVLPWSTCDNDWNTEHCALKHRNSSLLSNSTNFNGTDFNVTSYDANSTAYNFTDVVSGNMTNATFKWTTPSEEFWERHVLQLTEGIEDIGGIRWQLLICLAIAWVSVFLCLFKGVKSSGKVVYVTATFPYLVLTILLVRGVTLPGAIDGIKFYIIPDFEKLKDFEVWAAAAMQIFYSIGAAWGALITMASYNKFHHNCYRDALVVPLLNCSTSIFAGFVIFSIIGFMAHETGSTIAETVKQGPGLIFVVYPEAVAKMPISPLWSALFFLMVFTVGLGSQFGMFETMTSAFMDEFPKVLAGKKLHMVALMCCVEFLLGIPCVMQGGMYVLQIMDWYSSTFSLMIISFTELMVIGWIYGVNRFYGDIGLMLGHKPCGWWKVCWCFITPTIILIVFTFGIVSHVPVSYGENYVYPQWAIAIGWCLASLSMIPIPLFMIKGIVQTKGSLLERVRQLVRPASNWGPAQSRYFELYQQHLEGVDVNMGSVTKLDSSDSSEKMEKLLVDEAEETKVDLSQV